MSNLKPAPLFLTPQVTRALLGVGHANRMAALPVVALSETGALCSRLRIEILAAFAERERGNNPFVTTHEIIAQRVGISLAALDEHVAALRQCGCIHERLFRLTAKGFGKVAEARFAARQAQKGSAS